MTFLAGFLVGFSTAYTLSICVCLLLFYWRGRRQQRREREAEEQAVTEAGERTITALKLHAEGHSIYVVRPAHYLRAILSTDQTGQGN